MKRTILAIALALILIAGGVYASGWAKYSVTSVITATGTAVTAKPGYLFAAIVRGDKASTCTFDIYDYATNTAYVTTTEKELIPTLVITSTEVDWYQPIPFNAPVRFHYGLYHYIASTGEIAVYWLNDGDM